MIKTQSQGYAVKGRGYVRFGALYGRSNAFKQQNHGVY
jgi:hypothetical protein